GDYDNLRAIVSLRAGWNKLLVKSANKHQGWFLGARLTALDGTPLPSLRTSATPQATPTAAAADMTPVPSGLDRIANANRRRFLGARLDWYHGMTKEAVGPLSAFLGEAPGNLLAANYLAQASIANDEQGKALDVLDQAITRSGAPYTTALL